MTLSFTLPIPPVAKERARVTRFGSYTPARTKEFQNQVRMHAKKHAPKVLFKTPLSLQCDFYIAKPNRPKFIHAAVRPDIDNYLKAIMDSLNGIIWVDDSLIVMVTTAKYYTTDKPEIFISVKELT